MKIVVTGAAGFIGSHLVDALLARGDTVAGIDNFDPFYPREFKERNLSGSAKHPNLQWIEGDILERHTLARVITPECVVVHLAAKAGVRPSILDPTAYIRANVEGTAVVAEAMRRAGATRLVFGSSSSVYGNATPVPFREDAEAIEPISPYAASKRAAELLLISLAPLSGLQVAAMRYFTVFGPRQRPDLAIHAFARRMLKGESITLFGDGSQARDYTYCDDIIAGTIAGIDWTASAPVGVEVFNLGGKHPVPLAEMVSTLAAALRLEPRVEWLPMQPGDVERTSADVTKAGEILGYAPRVPFQRGIERFVEWCRDFYLRRS